MKIINVYNMSSPSSIYYSPSSIYSSKLDFILSFYKRYSSNYIIDIQFLYNFDFDYKNISDEYLLKYCLNIIPDSNNKIIIKNINEVHNNEGHNEINNFYRDLETIISKQKVFKLNLSNLSIHKDPTDNPLNNSTDKGFVNDIIRITKEFKEDFLNRSDNRKILSKQEYYKIILKYIYDNLLQDKTDKWIYYPDNKLMKYLKMRDTDDNLYTYKTFRKDLIYI